MKKKLLLTLLGVLMALSCAFGLVACGDGQTSNAPQKLSAPVVVLSGSTASWQADENADKFELSLGGSLSYVENTVTSKTLTLNQTLKVRAVGDGVNYSTSAWSNSVTYTDGTANPLKLGTPNVTVSSTGLASWAAVANASGYIYKINGGAENSTSSTSVQLVSGQSIVVKAVGDGVNFTDGEYSVSRTYVQGSVMPTGEEPTYLGIFASKNEPNSSNGLPEGFSSKIIAPCANTFSASTYSEYRSFEECIEDYFADEQNHFNGNYPKASDYDIYSSAGQTVYVEIWLNNPAQYTILSLMLNGVKHQVGGTLSSFFIEKPDTHYNCVYVAVTVPNGSYQSIDYTVSNIEYIANTYINADGTDEFMNNNDTVSIGLPYNATTPTVSNFSQQSVTCNGYSATFSLADNDGMLALCGGWLGVAVYDGENKFEILQNKEVSVGSNTISVTGLNENSYYTVRVYLYADLNDGYGVRVHYLYTDWIITPEVLLVNEIEQTSVLNATQTGYVGAIKVDVQLLSSSAEFIKLEILNAEQQVVYTDQNFDGSDTVSSGIFNKAGYTVKIYYKDNEYPEGKSVERYVYVGELSSPSFEELDEYTFVNDVIYSFKFKPYDNNYAAVDGVTVRFYDDNSARYIAEEVLTWIENPYIVDQLWGEWYALIEDSANYDEGSIEQIEISNQMKAIYDRISTLERAKTIWEDSERFDGNSDLAFWQAEKAKGKYYCEFTYSGTDTDNITFANGVYYVLVEDVNEYSGEFDVQVVANLVKNESKETVEYISNKGVRFKTLFLEDGYGDVELKDVALNGSEFTYTIYNTYDIKTDGESNEDLRFVYKISCNGEVLYQRENSVTPSIDEDGWIADYITGIKNGTLDAEALYKTYLPDYSPNAVTLDLSKVQAGVNRFLILFRSHDKVYDGDYEAYCGIDVEVRKRYTEPTLELDGYYGYVNMENEDGGNIVLEAYDKDGDEIIITINDLYWDYERAAYRFDFGYQGGKVRAKVSTENYGGEDGGQNESYWIDSEWTKYCYSEVTALLPVNFTLQGYNLTWTSQSASEYVERYVYLINDGEEQSGSSCYLYYQGSCTVKVKAIVSEQGKRAGYCDSEWKSYNYVHTSSGGKK